LYSGNGGINWILDKNSSNEIVFYNDNEFQIVSYVLDSLLFVIDSSEYVLLVKHIENQDVVLTQTIDNDVLPQNIYVTKKENGEICAYYYKKDGNTCASKSLDGGISWNGLNNW